MLSTHALAVDEVDGVPLVVADGPPPATCYLAFRVGWADEPLHLRGVTHLIEHLALGELGDQPYDYNGFVDPVRTVFHATGDPEHLGRFLTLVTKRLASLPFDRLTRERDILAAEAAGRGSSIVESMLGFRYGPQGYGGTASPELGLSWVDEATVEAWRSRYFTRGNAVVWTTTPAPLDVALPLPPGSRVAAPDAVAVLQTPGAIKTGWNGVTATVVTPRSSALTVGIEVLRRRAFRELRERRGLSYGVNVDVLPLGLVQRHVALVADCLPHQATATTEAMVDTLRSSLAPGVLEDDVAAVRTFLERQWSGWNAPSLDAFGVADDVLHDQPHRPLADVVAELRAVDAPAVAEALRAAEGSLLLGVRSDDEVPDGLARIPDGSPRAHPGRVFKRAGWESHSGQKLTVGREGISLRWPTGLVVSVASADCLAVGWWHDGTRRLWGRDGFVVDVYPWAWEKGEQLLAQLDTLCNGVPHVPMGGDSGHRPPPPPPPRFHPVLKIIVLVMGGLISLVMLGAGLFDTPTFEQRYSDPIAQVPGAVDGAELCGRPSKDIWLSGPDVPADVAPQHRLLVDEACRDAASEDMGMAAAGGAGVGIVSAVTLVGLRRRRRRARAPAPTGSPV